MMWVRSGHHGNDFHGFSMLAVKGWAVFTLYHTRRRKGGEGAVSKQAP